MASRSPFLEENLSCSICTDIFQDPVIVACSHTFCEACLESWWKSRKMRECPFCKSISIVKKPPINLVLKNLCEAFLLKRDHVDHGDQRAPAGSEPLCSLHNEKLKLFCLDHQQPVCLICRDSKAHTNHRFRPMDKAAQDHKEELQGFLKPFQEKLKVFDQVKRNCDQTAEHIKVQSQRTETQIKEEFKKLHQFLQKEEEARITALSNEKKQKSQMMQRQIEGLNREISALSEKIRVREMRVESLKAKGASFLQNYKAAVERLQRPLPADPELLPGALLDEAKHLGNLGFNVWQNMQYEVSYTPVILDPNSAHSELTLSADLTGVRRGKTKKVPDNPEIFGSHCYVLGSEGFDSGTHSWDVQVGDNTYWVVGVLERSVQGNRVVDSGLWRVGFFDSEYRSDSPSDPVTILPVKEKVRAITVHLDWDKGELTFSNTHTKTHIHTFTHTFTGKLFPYINTWDKDLLTVLPMDVSVTI